MRGEAGLIRTLAARLTGSPDIYPQPDREPNRSINFVVCHDGFTLADLVTYDHKHNEANGHHNQDGRDPNFSWNCGVEGPTADPDINALRLRQMKNLLTILCVSQGTPMLSMGDEVQRTQGGNNNAYCQDNETSWFNWDDVPRHADFLRFVRELIAFTQQRNAFQQEHFWTTVSGNASRTRLTWHGVNLGQPDWRDDSRSLAFTLHDLDNGEQLHLMLNAYWQSLTFDLPPLLPHQGWVRLVDTALPAPDDFVTDSTAAEPIPGQYRVEARSVVIVRSAAVAA